MSKRHVTPKTEQEAADQYKKVVIVTKDKKYRVIVCRNDIQWIIQRRTRKAGDLGWFAIAFCRRRETLLRRLMQETKLDSRNRRVLEALPDTFL